MRSLRVLGGGCGYEEKTEMTELINIDCLNYLTGDTPSFDLVVADPPYSSGGMVRSDRNASTKTKYISSDSANQDKLLNFEGDNRDQRSYLMWSMLWMGAAYDRMRDGAILAVFTDWRQLPVTTDAIQCGGFVWRGIVPWYKPASRPQPDRFTSSCEYIVWGTKGARSMTVEEGSAYPEGFYKYSPPQNRVHVTEKPVDLYKHIFRLAKSGDWILDPFLGSGTSAIAAHAFGNLNFIGLEKKQDIYDAALKRLREHQAQTNLFFDVKAVANG